MLTRTFCHVPGVGPVLERRLWSAGVYTWQVAQAMEELPLSAARSADLRREAERSSAELAQGNVRYFGGRLPAREQWRLLSHFRTRAAYLDIETTGLASAANIVTTVVVYDGRTVRSFVHGQNLEEVGNCLAAYDLLVTYNGASFDLPFLRHALGLTLTQAHIDLRYVLGGLGYRGGLKGCERQLGLPRGDLADVDGFFAVLLWREYQDSKDPRVLETLLAYNTLDVVHLEPLALMAYNEKLAQTPFTGLQLPVPRAAASPFAAHAGIIERVRSRYALP